jgi:ADP-heptose:LPS heptosyltransferase
VIYVLLTLLLQPLLRLTSRRCRTQVQSILVVQTAKIGDAICTSPMLRELRRAYPKANITVACAALTAPLFANNPHVSNIVAIDSGTLKGWTGKWRQAAALRREGFDVAICCNAGATWPVVLAWAGIPRRIGLVPNYSGSTTQLAGRLWSASAAHRSGRMVMETYFDMLRTLGLSPDGLDKEVFATAGAMGRVTPLLREGVACMGVAVSAGNKLKELGQEKLTEIIHGLLTAQSGSCVILLGTSADRKAAGAIIASLPQAQRSRVIDTTGELGLDELPALMSGLAIFVGVDSGLTYMADALGIPLVSVAGPADMADARPLGPRAVILRRDLPCAPCSHYFLAPYDCRIGTRACVTEVSAGEIVSAARRLLGNANVR